MKSKSTDYLDGLKNGEDSVLADLQFAVTEHAKWPQDKDVGPTAISKELGRLQAENALLREALALIMPLAERYVARLESGFHESDDNGALYADWQDALAELEAAKSILRDGCAAST